jgi:K+-sensing histidine kinase KdpD
VEIVVSAATPATAIVDYATEHGIDLIVMGTHGRSAVAHLLLGSVAEKVVRVAPCPVLTVRPDEREWHGIDRRRRARRPSRRKPLRASRPAAGKRSVA